MPDKRKASMAPSYSKRPRISYEDEEDQASSVTPYEKPVNHPLYGQKNAFPGLDDGGDELCYGDADDGLEYLRMVRSEASALPSLFSAKTSKEDQASNYSTTTTIAQTKPPSFPPGFFDKEEAYVAPVEHNKTTVATSQDPYPEAQSAYYNLLRHRFKLLRSTLKCSPPAAVIAALDHAHPISLPRRVEAARKEWRRLVMSVDPQMAQLACMDMDSVFGVLQIMARMMSDVLRSGDAEKIRRIGAWAWGLLGKCREIGELSTAEVGDIRDLGKRAAKILQKIREADDTMQMEDEELPDSETGEEELAQEEVPAETDEPEDQTTQTELENGNDADMADVVDEAAELEAAKARLQAKMQGSGDSEVDAEDDSVSKQTRAMLDMVIMVVGEFYGQRDLLDSRDVWTVSV